MNQEKYKCDYCEEPFIPKRKDVQRFCNSKCRKKFSYHKNKVAKINVPKANLSQQLEEIKNKKIKLEEMSWSGVGNAAAGTGLVEAAKALINVVKPEEHKAETKGDIDRLESKINIKIRFELIVNEPTNEFGQHAYFDHETKFKVYRGVKKNLNTSNNVI